MYLLLDNIKLFLSMGGYGGFVWASFITMLIIFIPSLLLPLRRFRKIKAQLRRQS